MIKSLLKTYLVHLVVLVLVYIFFALAHLLATPYLLWVGEFKESCGMYRFKDFTYTEFKTRSE